MSKALDHVLAVSDPSRPGYDPASPYYDVTADSSSTFFVGPIAGDHKSGDELRAEAIAAIDEVTGPPGGFMDLLFGPVKNTFTQAVYQSKLEASRQELTGNVELRTPGEPPRTMWENASHEQMVEVISSNADSSVVAVTSEEWVRLGNDLSDHQESFGKAINNSLGNWDGTSGDAARRHLAQVATWLGGTAEGAVLTGRQQEIHSQALSETQRVMADNPPVPFSAPEANARLATITDPAQFAMQFQTELDTFNQQQAARGQAAAVMQRFDETVGGAATTPRFTAPPTLLRATRTTAPLMGTPAEPLSARRDSAQAVATTFDENGLSRNGTPAGTTPSGNGTLPNSLPAANLPAPGGQGTPALPSVPQSAGFTPATFTAPSGVNVPSGVVTPASFTPPNAPTVPSGYPGGNLPGNGITTPSTFTKPTVPSGPFGDAEPTTRIAFPPRNKPTAQNPGQLPGGVPPVTGGTPGGSGPGVSRFGGPGGVPGGGPGGGPGAPGSGTPGGRGGFGPMGGGAGGAASGVAGGAPGGPGAPGSGVPGARGAAAGAPMGGGGAPGGRSRGEDDDEHQAASYLEGDADVFAPGSVVSPPVIGDWHGNQDWK